MTAYHLKRVDWLEDLLTEQFITRATRATDKKGEYIIKHPEQIFNAEARRSEILGEKQKIKHYNALLQIAKNVKEYERKKEANNNG